MDAQGQADAPGGIIVAVKTEAEEEQKPASLLLEAGSAVKVLILRIAAMSCHVAVMSFPCSQNL